MTKKELYIAVIVTILVGCEVTAQTQPTQINCTQTLRTARGTYDQGRLHEIPAQLNGCFTKNEDHGGFTQAERIEAYRMLTLSYIYLEEPDKADEAMINLLHTDPFFQINKDVDPIEFQNLYRKFRTNPVFRVGLKFGANYNHINVQENHYMWAASAGKGKYKSKIGIQFGALFEKDLTERFILNPEILYTSNAFTYSNGTPLFADVPAERKGDLLHTISQSRIQLNILVQYKLKKPVNIADGFIPYVAIGPSVSYLMNSSFDGNTNVGEEKTGSEFKTTENYKLVTLSVVGVAGLKLKVGSFYISADARFHYGLMNMVNEDNRLRWNAENIELLDYGYVDNDYTMSQSMFNLGIIFPKFNPKKLIK